MKVIAVIGAMFGDEGKGRMVDYFTSANKLPAVVIRYNGGAQAGHTVVYPDGTRHVFHHFGAGTLAGAATYLSRFFIANPILFANEYQELKLKNVSPVVSASLDMPISTPYDMMLNREIELSRGNKRHGSCGYGVSETVQRLCKSPYKLFISDALYSPVDFKKCLKQIRTVYVKKRLSELKITIPSKAFTEALESDDILEHYLADTKLMVNTIRFESIVCLGQYQTIIFEGAQGLGLDERGRFFPHVTRSKTGLDNIETLCRELCVNEIDVCYVTRAYATRHGAGPLPTEDKSLLFEDDTNIDNHWQGKMRFGHLDLDLLREHIKKDLSRTKLKTINSIAVTCADQVQDSLKIKYSNSIFPITKQELPEWVSRATGIGKVLFSKSRKRT
jgi:adenylosuccinate synthase